MRKVSRSALVPYAPEEMFALVSDIEAYPMFLPWCRSARVHEASRDVVEATLEFGRGGVRKSFRTRNFLQRPESIRLELVTGPFRQLSGAWSFRGLGTGGTKVALDIGFEFNSRVTDFVLGPFFEEICNSLVDAFTRRAFEVHGQVANGRR
jgi:ribosome-associated toxin RatA of RatAB toxin-antitoxin module